jgi:hypothetical protein
VIAAEHDAAQDRLERVEGALYRSADELSDRAIEFILTNTAPEKWANTRALAYRLEQEAADARRREMSEAGDDDGETIMDDGRRIDKKTGFIIYEDDNWYGVSTADTEAIAASEADIAERGAFQADYLRETLGQDGDGIVGGAQGPRP